MTSSDRPKPKNVASPHDPRDAHARFIPRDELKGFAAWQPGDLAGGPAAQSNVQRKAEEPKLDVAEQIAAQLRATRQAGYQDGYRDGIAALEAFKQSFARQTGAQVSTLLQSMQGALDGLQQELARGVAVTATRLARQVVRSEIECRPAAIASVAQEALDTLLLSARHITLRVHPDDHALVAQAAAEGLAARGARLLADVAMQRGGCLVESDIGVVDASLEARWRRAVAAVGVDEPWTPGSDDDDDGAVERSDA